MVAAAEDIRMPLLSHLPQHGFEKLFTGIFTSSQAVVFPLRMPPFYK
jgi:hypothetical protein